MMINHDHLRKLLIISYQTYMQQILEHMYLYLVLLKRAIWLNLIRFTKDWSLSELIKSDSFTSKPKKFEPDLTHHELVG